MKFGGLLFDHSAHWRI